MAEFLLLQGVEYTPVKETLPYLARNCLKTSQNFTLKSFS